MRNMRCLIGLALAAAAASCGSDKTNKGAQAPSDMTAAGPPTYQEQAPGPASVSAEPRGQTGTPSAGETTRSELAQLNALQLVEGTFNCMLSSRNQQGAAGSRASMSDEETTPGDTAGPKAFEAPTSGTSTSGANSAMAERSTGTSGLGRPSSGTTASGCSDTAEAAGVLPTDLAKGDSVAVNGMRQFIQTRLTAATSTTEVNDNTVALFDKGVAALKEGQAAREAMAQKTEAKQSKSVKSPQSDLGAGQDQIREHRALGELFQFGKNLGMTPIGSEAQALSWVVGVDRFVGTRDLPVRAKPLAAEPLFSALLDVSAPAPTAGRPSPTWNQYLAAAARSVSATSGATRANGGVGGGPAPTADEKGNLRDVGMAVQDRMQIVAQHLPPSSRLKEEVQRTVSDLRDFAGMSSATGASPSTGPTKSGTSTGPTKSGTSTSPKSGTSMSPKSDTSTDQSRSGTSPSTTDSTGRSGGTTGKSPSPR